MHWPELLRSAWRFLHFVFLRCQLRWPRKRCLAFSGASVSEQSGIGPIFVINLDREPKRWADVVRELDCFVDAAGKSLSGRAIRYSAYDAQADLPEFRDSADVDPFYALGDQLFVEPQPHASPDAFDLERPIRMSRAEIAIARSHIGVWKAVAQAQAPYSLVLEDDVWVDRSFGRILDQAWRELEDADGASPSFDILYVSYKQVRYGAQKEVVSKNIIRPERGLWCLAGYVLSKKGAQALLDRLPCRGPIDLWVNQAFHELRIRALHRSLINQRRDLRSTNFHSVLPTLRRIGVLDRGEASAFGRRPACSPVFAFGSSGSGLSSLAMALSMLGYRCCSDYDSIPENEFAGLLAGRKDRVFDAYVNIASLTPQVRLLAERYPDAKYIIMGDVESVEDRNDIASIVAALNGADVLHLFGERASSWRALCEYLKLAPPDAPYPVLRDLGWRRYRGGTDDRNIDRRARWLRSDVSPWIAERRAGWNGIGADSVQAQGSTGYSPACFDDDLTQIQPRRWLLRTDTFPRNLGLFRAANIAPVTGGGISLAVIRESLGVRDFSAAAVSSCARFLYGRFEATLQATDVPGLVTGFGLRRRSPRQEIDFEIRGDRPDQLRVNVYYNPGTEGAKLDYGDRGTPAIIPLGFDSSKALHQFAIEWDPEEIRWFVDQKLVHRRATWNPVPIPHLPMTLHVSTWPARSYGWLGRLAVRALPASAIVRRIIVDAYNADMPEPDPQSTAARVPNRSA